MCHGVLHEVELAALPGHSGEDGLLSSLESGVVVTDDELDAVHAAVYQALEKLAPVRLGLAQLHATAEDASLAVGTDPDGREEGTRHDRPVVPDLFVAGIEDEVGDLADWPVSPGPELLVEFGCRSAQLRGRDVEATEFLDNGRHLPSADALDIHLGDGQSHYPLAADASLE
jgi:hypothetical protein